MRGGREAITRAREKAEAQREDLLVREEIRLDKLRFFAKRKVKMAGLSQAAFARQAGVSSATISVWFSGQSELGAETFRKVCGALHDLQPDEAMISVLHESEALAATG